jgi:hypothetical protein
VPPLAGKPNPLDPPVLSRKLAAGQSACLESIDETAQRYFSHLQGGRNFTLIHQPSGMPSEMSEHGELRSCQSHRFRLFVESMPSQARDIVKQSAD